MTASFMTSIFQSRGRRIGREHPDLEMGFHYVKIALTVEGWKMNA
ncbi:hypothetical protein [Bacillus sp. REN3]|nr:hypothetical protein [Bacillus sp. REN3]